MPVLRCQKFAIALVAILFDPTFGLVRPKKGPRKGAPKVPVLIPKSGPESACPNSESACPNPA